MVGNVTRQDNFERNGIYETNHLDNSTKASGETNERRLRHEASIIVVCVFPFLTVAAFCCCRYIPELIMDKCNVLYSC